ncbi:MAG: aspartate aminotransferase family protein [Christensenellales bacterium]|jgi:aminotransferase, acetylornithine/succinylornithine family
MELKKIKELSNKNYMNVFHRQNICFVRGDKNKLYDTTGKEYTDFVSGIGVNCLGYNDPELVKAISDQAAKLIHSSNLYYNEEQAVLCEKLLEGSIFTKMFLANSGAEANECAIKLVRKHYNKRGQNRPVIVTANGSFHGRTLATLTATGQESHYRIYEPLPSGFRHVPYGDLNALKDALTDDVGAIMLEVIQSRSAIRPADYDYLVGAYALCRAKDVLFILDEIQTGMGRTGKMFAFEHHGLQPDIVTVAKGMGGGLPISAVLARGDVAGSFAIGDHGSTLSGNQLACAAATVVVDKLKNGLIDRVADTGDYLAGKLAYFKKYKFVKDVKGLGLLQSVELGDNINGNYVAAQLLSAGILVNCTKKNVIRLLPPYTIEKSEIDEFAEKLDDIFSVTNV